MGIQSNVNQILGTVAGAAIAGKHLAQQKEAVENERLEQMSGLAEEEIGKEKKWSKEEYNLENQEAGAQEDLEKMEDVASKYEYKNNKLYNKETGKMATGNEQIEFNWATGDEYGKLSNALMEVHKKQEAIQEQRNLFGKRKEIILKKTNWSEDQYKDLLGGMKNGK